jgi:Ca2+-binding RTX toxin-like protein
MPSVTVLGVGHEIVTLNYDSAANANIAAMIAAAISHGVETGSVVPVNGSGGAVQVPPPVPPGKTGEFVQKQDGLSSMLPGYKDVVVTAGAATVLGSGDANEAILSSEGDLTFIATGGSGTVVAGGAAPSQSRGNDDRGDGDRGHGDKDHGDKDHGDRDHGHGDKDHGNGGQGSVGGDLVIIPGSDNGNWGIYTGGGNDTVLALGGGNDTIATDSGRNLIELGSGHDSVQSTGQDSINTGSGSDTIDATGAKSDVVHGGTGHVLFVGGAGAVTLFGGAGSDTFEGGSGRAVVFGGQGGHNSLLGGTGTATLFGGGAGDHLFAQGADRQALLAGIGNETLSAAMATGHDSLVAGSGNDLLIGGSGNDTFYGGTGASTMDGGSGHDIFAFAKSLNGGTDLVVNFTSVDKIALQGFGPHAVENALNSQTFANGSVTISLPDNTRVTFAGISELTKSNFT